MEIPPSLFANFARWNLLSTFRGSADHRMLLGLIRDALEPEKLALFAQLVEENEGYALYQSVSRAKMQLSSQERARLSFRAHGIEIDAEFGREDFEGWIADDLARIEGALDEALARAGLAEGGVDRVFLTGGTSFVPAVRRIFARRFGAERLESGDELLSIAHGLALIGAREDVAAWEAPA
jgi:hypothetical chaperone protein